MSEPLLRTCLVCGVTDGLPRHVEGVIAEPDGSNAGDSGRCEHFECGAQNGCAVCARQLELMTSG